MDNVIYPRFGLHDTRKCGTAAPLVSFPGARRAAQIAAQLCQQHHYGLTTTQQLQAAAVRFYENTGKSPAYAAQRLVRPPNESFFVGPDGWAA